STQRRDTSASRFPSNPPSIRVSDHRWPPAEAPRDNHAPPVSRFPRLHRPPQHMDIMGVCANMRRASQNEFMRKSSQMSSSRGKATARAPQRERGKRRVAALLKAAASSFAEKGYDAVTMTEVAARARAPIGSLYQFFPSKEALADALLDRFS